jgi:hypothetical protein
MASSIAGKIRHNIWDFQAVFPTCHTLFSANPRLAIALFSCWRQRAFLEIFYGD